MRILLGPGGSVVSPLDGKLSEWAEYIPCVEVILHSDGEKRMQMGEMLRRITVLTGRRQEEKDSLTPSVWHLLDVRR